VGRRGRTRASARCRRASPAEARALCSGPDRERDAGASESVKLASSSFQDRVLIGVRPCNKCWHNSQGDKGTVTLRYGVLQAYIAEQKRCCGAMSEGGHACGTVLRSL
jgi:hypothetical protein